MDWSILVASLATALSSVGLLSVISDAYRRFRAERQLANQLRALMDMDRDLTLSRLENVREKLSEDFPDPETVAFAITLLTSAADKLPKGQRREILGALNRGSEKSRANYAARLIDEVEAAMS
jgi:hypothetical protein